MGLGSSTALSCGVGGRRSWDPELLRLWCRLATVALIRPLDWELPYVEGVALKSRGKKKKKGIQPQGLRLLQRYGFDPLSSAKG